MFLSCGGSSLIGECCFNTVYQVGGEREERLDTVHTNVPRGAFNGTRKQEKLSESLYSMF